MPGWAIIPLHHQLADDRARNEELWGFYCRWERKALSHGASAPVSTIVCFLESGKITSGQSLGEKSPLSWSISACIHYCLFFRVGKNHIGLFRSSSDSTSSPRGDECTMPSAAVGPPQHTRWWQGYTGDLPLGGGRCKGAVSQSGHEQ